MCFDNLKPGDRIRIVSLKRCEPIYRHRLLTMGLTKGSEFTVLRVAPLGDPVQITIRGFLLGLRRKEALNLDLQRLG